MKENWTRPTNWLTLDLNALTDLIQPLFKGHQVVNAQLTTGGFANTNYRLQISGRNQPVLLRLFVRDPKTAKKEFAISQLVKSRVPVAEFLFFAESNPVTGHPYAILEWIDGVMLISIAQSTSPQELAKIGFGVGETLAKIQSFKFDCVGFLNSNLKVSEPISLGREGFLAYIHQNIIQGQGHQRLGVQLTEQFWTFVQHESYILDDFEAEPCLVHSDYDGSNILLQQTENGWITRAVLDWEFAYSGWTLADIGHILRPPLGSISQFEDYLLEGFAVNGGFLPSEWKRISKLFDLLAWVDFLSRDTASNEVINSAQQVLLDTMNSWSRF